MVTYRNGGDSGLRSCNARRTPRRGRLGTLDLGKATAMQVCKWCKKPTTTARARTRPTVNGGRKRERRSRVVEHCLCSCLLTSSLLEPEANLDVAGSAYWQSWPIYNQIRDILDESLESERGSLGIVGIRCGSTGLVNKIAFDLQVSVRPPPNEYFARIAFHILSMSARLFVWSRNVHSLSSGGKKGEEGQHSLSLFLSPRCVVSPRTRASGARIKPPLCIARAQ